MSLVTVNLSLVSPFGTEDTPNPASGSATLTPEGHGKYGESLRTIESKVAPIIQGVMEPVELTPGYWRVTVAPTKGNPWPEMTFLLEEGMPEPVNLALLAPETVINGKQLAKGDPGPGITGWEDNGDGSITFLLSDGTELGPVVMPAGADGEDGKSAYEIAVSSGFIGTEEEWLSSLQGVASWDDLEGKPDLSSYVQSTTISEIWTGTQAEYDVLTPDENTLYVIREA